MHKFKAGDKVQLKSPDGLAKEFGDNWRNKFYVVDTMLSNLGQVVTVRCRDTWGGAPGYTIEEGSWFYFEELFVGTDEELKEISIKLSFDDLIK